jgi:hypothetical protein
MKKPFFSLTWMKKFLFLFFLFPGVAFGTPATAARFYFNSTTNSAPVNIRFGLGLSAGWNDTSVAGSSNWRGQLKSLSQKTNSASATRTENNDAASTPNNICFGMWISDPLENQTVRGTIKGQAKYRESNSAASATCAIAVYIIDKTGAAVTNPQVLAITASDANTVTPPEFSTTFTNRRHLNVSEATPITLTTAFIPESGRIVIERGAMEIGTTTTHTVNIRTGDEVDSSDLAENDTQTSNGIGWVEFSNPLAFFSACDKQDTLQPTSLGTYTDWVSSSGCPALCACSQTNIWTFIDESNNHDADATYVWNDVLGGTCSTLPGKVSFGVVDFASAFDTIDSVRMVAWARSTTAGDTLQLFMRTSSDLNANPVNLTTSYAYYDFTSATKPGGGGWTDAAVDSLQIGVRNASNGSEPRVTSAYAVVFYSSGCTAGDNRRRRILTGEKENDKEKKNEEMARKSPAFVFGAPGVWVK